MPASLILNPKPAATACACARLEVYGLMCRKCAWRLLTPPPLVGAEKDWRDVHKDAPKRSGALLAERVSYHLRD